MLKFDLDLAESCPKCASGDTWVRYCDACGNDANGFTTRRLCRHGEAEHFHRGCRHCSYTWRTDDVIDAKVVCSRG